jgi:hypothetical protein
MKKNKVYVAPLTLIMALQSEMVMQVTSNPNEVKVNTNGEKFDASQALSREAEPRSVWDD